DGIDTMVDAIASGDFESFYMINNEYGAPRGDAFTDAIGRFTTYIDRYRTELEAGAARNMDLAIMAVGAALAIGLLLAILARLFLGRMVLRPLAEVAGHFEKMAAGDLTSHVEA